MSLSSTFIHCPNLRNIPNLVHGFTTRRGGVSGSPFDTLNLGLNTADDPESVEANYERFTKALKFSRESIFGTRQVHEAEVVEVDASMDVSTIQALNADALITSRNDILLTVKVADCLPILLIDSTSQAIAAVHAGSSTLAGILPKAISALQKTFQVQPQNLLMAIGPGIGFSAFEVGFGVGALFRKKLSVDEKHIRWMEEKAYLNLAAINADLAIRAGVPKERVWDSGLCTYSNESQFFSYRRDGKDTGRMLGFIGWRSTSS